LVLTRTISVDGVFDEAATVDYYNNWLLGRIVTTSMVKPGVHRFETRLDTASNSSTSPTPTAP
jgi:hypothetical protein